MDLQEYRNWFLLLLFNSWSLRLRLLFRECSPDNIVELLFFLNLHIYLSECDSTIVPFGNVISVQVYDFFFFFLVCG